MTTSASPHLFWITSRAAGVIALILASVAVSLGLLMSTKLLRRRGPDLLAVHEVLSIAAIVAMVIHGVALLGDGYLKASLADIAVPFAFSYKTFWTSIGIIAGWGMVILGLSYYVRHWIGAARWRRLHRLTAVVWLAGLMHSLGEGTDAGQPWFLAMVAVVVLPAIALLLARTAGRGGPAGSRGGRAPDTVRGDILTVPHGAVPTAGVAVRG